MQLVAGCRSARHLGQYRRMPGYDDLLKNFKTDAARVLPPIIEDVCSQLGIETDANRQAILDALVRAYTAGTTAGQVESAAQAIESGVDVHIQQLRSDD